MKLLIKVSPVWSDLRVCFDCAGSAVDITGAGPDIAIAPEPEGSAAIIWASHYFAYKL